MYRGRNFCEPGEQKKPVRGLAANGQYGQFSAGGENSACRKLPVLPVYSQPAHWFFLFPWFEKVPSTVVDRLWCVAQVVERSKASVS